MKRRTAIHRVFRRFALFLLLLQMLSSVAAAQTLGGTPGLILAPSAEMSRDGSFRFGASYVPREALEYTGHRRDAAVVFLSLTYLPFLELDLRLTRQLNIPKGSIHTVDRSPVVRLRLFRQRGYLPAVVIGLHDFLSTIESGEARHFAASYLVVTRRFVGNTWAVAPTVGFSRPLYSHKQSELVGWFGGLSIGCSRFPFMSLLFDYANGLPSIGADFIFGKHLQAKAAWIDYRYFCFNTGLQINLFAVFKK